MTIYSIDPPFETARRLNAERCVATAYDGETNLFWVGVPGSPDSRYPRSADELDPTPPLPVAARKPKAGQVWVTNKLGLVRMVLRQSHRGWELLAADGKLGWMPLGTLSRLATPEEAKPFRPFREMVEAFIHLCQANAVDVKPKGPSVP